jgi:hypothetical protein
VGILSSELDEPAGKRLATQLCHGIIKAEKWNIQSMK